MPYDVLYSFWIPEHQRGAMLLDMIASWFLSEIFCPASGSRIEVRRRTFDPYEVIRSESFSLRDFTQIIEAAGCYKEISVIETELRMKIFDITEIPGESENLTDAIIRLESSAYRRINGKEPRMEPVLRLRLPCLQSNIIAPLKKGSSYAEQPSSQAQNHQCLEKLFFETVATFGPDYARAFSDTNFLFPMSASCCYFKNFHELLCDLYFIADAVDKGLGAYNMPRLSDQTDQDFLHFCHPFRDLQDIERTRVGLENLRDFIHSLDDEELIREISTKISRSSNQEGQSVVFLHEPFLSRLISDCYLGLVES